MRRKRQTNTKDFHVTVLEEDRMFETIPVVDAGLDEYLEDYVSETDLPDSDRAMICQRKGLDVKRCLHR